MKYNYCNIVDNITGETRELTVSEKKEWREIARHVGLYFGMNPECVPIKTELLTQKI